jgi:murein DD-endopeptidase MepM/ murein hydrolase activator NlpD
MKIRQKLLNLALWGLSSLSLAVIMAVSWHSGVSYGIQKNAPLPVSASSSADMPDAQSAPCFENYFDEQERPQSAGRLIRVQLYNNSELPEFREHTQALRGEFQELPESWPVNYGYISSFFGKRSAKRMHKGIDIVAPPNTPIFAIAAGVVEAEGSLRGYGKYIDILHNNGLISRYAHNSENMVKKGEFVERGERIALVGATGNTRTTHVHFELRDNGVAIDPLPYLFATLSSL